MVKKISKQLPPVLQTDLEKEFYSATFDQLFSPAEVKQAQGFIGRRSSDIFQPGVDNYLTEPTKERAAYQLEPIAYAVNAALKESNEMFYMDFIDYINFKGGNVDNHDRLFAADFYSFAPPIDVDKYLNYQNYIWLPDGAPIIYVQYAGAGGGAAFDSIIESLIIGASTFNTSQSDDLRPRGLQFSSGMRVRFEGSASYDRSFYIEGVGRQIRLVEELTTLLPGSSIFNVPWDNGIIFDGGTGYVINLASVDSVVNPGRDYAVSDVLTLVSPGGAGVTTAATVTVASLTPSTDLSTIAAQTQANFDGTGSNGTFSGGTGYIVSDTITLADGSVITVDAVSAGVVTQFTITTASATSFTTGSTLGQTSTSGSGSSFSITTGTANETPINGIASVTITTAGDYLFAPPNPVSVTGGSGSAATFDVTIEGELLTVDGGTYTAQATVRALEVDATGVIINAEFVSRGTYSVFPSVPATLSGGSGTGASVTFVEGGDTGELFDPTGVTYGFDASVKTDLSTADYLTIERGSAEGSPWTRTNRWFNVDVIDITQSLGQVLDATIVNGGLNYSVNDVLPVIGDGINGTVTVTAVNSVGTITAVRVSGRGQGYSYGSIDQTGIGGGGTTVEWDQYPPGINLPNGTTWDQSFAWDQEIIASGGTNAVIDISLATAVSKSNKASRPILEYRRDLQLYEFGNKYLTEVQVVADTETLTDVEGKTSYVIDGVTLADGMKMVFLDPSPIPTFFEWDQDPTGTNSYWDAEPWEVQGSTGAVSRFIWQVDLSSGSIALNKVDPFTGVVGDSANPVPVGGVVLATEGNAYAGDSFYQYQDPLNSSFTWKLGQRKSSVNTEPLYQLYDSNGIALDDSVEYPDSTFVGNEIFSYRILTAADLEGTGGTLTIDPVLGFPLTLKGLQQISDIVFENDLETNRAYNGTTEIPGYYFFRQWTTDAYANVVADIINGVSVQQSTYETNWLVSPNVERQRVIDRFLTESDTQDKFFLSALPLEEPGAILVAEGRRLNTDEFAFVPNQKELIVFEKPTQTGYEAADGIKQLFSFGNLTDPIEVYVNGQYQIRNTDYTVIESLQLNTVTLSAPGSGYTVGDLLTAVGGTYTVPAQVRVVSVDGSGGVSGMSITNAGIYTELPSNPFALSGGTGSGAFVTGDFLDATGGVFTIKFNGPVAAGGLVEARQQGSGAPGKNKVVEVIYSTHDPITEDERGFFQIPNGLENNPNNLEILDQSWNEFAPHMVSIIENQYVYLGTAFGSINNYRDTLKDGSQGTFILQSQAPMLKAMLVSSSDSLDLVEAMRFNSREYARYRNKFMKTAKQMIDQGFQPFNYGDAINVDQWVDEAIRRIVRSREFSTAFEDTYMASWNTVYQEETFTATGVDDFTTLTIFADVTAKTNAMYLYIDGKIQAIDADYTISNYNPIQIKWTTIPAAGASIVARLYESSAPAHIPATPAKLGLQRPSRPHIETDDSYRTPTQVIVGHDGSRTPIYGDYRDDLLLELETRIYNGILDKFRNDYDVPLEIHTYKPGKFRTTRWSQSEYDALARPGFFKWVSDEKADYITNQFYDANDPWTWNYSEVEDIDGELLPGYWRGIFDRYYDTQRPNETPWEMLGFVTMPDWWVSTKDTGDGFSGYGAGPWPSTSSLWSDLEAGIVRRGFRAGTDTRYARPGLVSKYLPVDNTGALKSTPLECIDTTASLQAPNTAQAAKNWKYGDLAPVEYAWLTSEQYPFSEMRTLFLARPGQFGEQFWHPEYIYNVPIRPQQVVSSENGVLKRVSNSSLYVHGETVNGVKEVNTGYQVWITSRLRSLNKQPGADFGQYLRTLDVKLGHKMAGFTDKDTMNVFVEGISVSSQATNLLVPKENITVSLHTSPPVKEYFYGGVLLRTTDTGGYQVFGYDVLAGEFNYVPRVQSANDRNINVGGEPEQYTNFATGTTYMRNQIVRLNTVFYRCLVTHEATSFIKDNWEKLSKLPIVGGINVTYHPSGSGTAQLQYGEELDTPQEVFDFLIGYGDYLASQGWQFNKLNPDSGEIENWLLSGKDFLFWTQTNWAPNNIIMLSPLANQVELIAQEGYPAAIEKIVNGVYSILDKNGVVIDPVNIYVQRDDRNVKIESLIDQLGIYAARVNTTDTESIVTFDNTTSFDDSIYDPLLGTRLARLRFQGRRTTNWTGKLEAGGYIITQDKLIPNFENMVNSIRLYHDTETTLDNPDMENAARHLIGFDTRTYFDNLEILDEAQYQFFQGLIRQKGTVQSIRKLERSSVVGETNVDMQVLEEWALKLSPYGNICSNELIEFLIAANEVKVDPQLVQVSYPASNTVGNKVFFQDTDVSASPTNTITIVNHGFSTGDLKKFIIPVGETGAISGLDSGAIYYVTVVDANTIKLSLPSSPTTYISLTVV